MFFSKAKKISPPVAAPVQDQNNADLTTIDSMPEPEPKHEVYEERVQHLSEPQEEYPEEEPTESEEEVESVSEDEEDEDSELQALERKKEELIQRKKAKEEERKRLEEERKSQVKSGSSDDDVLLHIRYLSERVTRLESYLFRTFGQ